jgi:murein DD-endopeptidase MepM/ murein hydrolase activator NlpD
MPSAGAAAPSDAPPSAAGADPATLGQGLFAWPVRGDILSTFGPKPGSQANDGVDIASNEGDPVRAAAAGEVVYSGNSVPGFGNFILIRHQGGWVTAYAHLGSIAVKMRQLVIQGQEIGSIGKTGDVGVAELHFEMRYAASDTERARPIDPLLVLPK